jgi:hypothetical protein
MITSVVDAEDAGLVVPTQGRGPMSSGSPTVAVVVVGEFEEHPAEVALNHLDVEFANLPDDGASAFDRPSRTVERCKETVAHDLALHTSESIERRPHQLVVAGR